MLERVLIFILNVLKEFGGEAEGFSSAFPFRGFNRSG
jgi:hypothetical protein